MTGFELRTSGIDSEQQPLPILPCFLSQVKQDLTS